VPHHQPNPACVTAPASATRLSVLPPSSEWRYGQQSGTVTRDWQAQTHPEHTNRTGTTSAMADLPGNKERRLPRQRGTVSDRLEQRGSQASSDGERTVYRRLILTVELPSAVITRKCEAPWAMGYRNAIANVRNQRLLVHAVAGPERIAIQRDVVQYPATIDSNEGMAGPATICAPQLQRRGIVAGGPERSGAEIIR